MKKSVCILLAALMVLAVLSGCQQTPDNPLVVGKDTTKLLEMAQAAQDTQGNLADVLDVTSDRFETNLKDQSGNIKVAVNADVVLPDVDSIPLVRVEAQPFSQKMVDQLIAALFDNGKLYEPDSLTQLTKSEISERLLQLKLKKAELEQQGMKPLNPDSEDEGEAAVPDGSSNIGTPQAINQLDMVIGSIAAMEELLETAPDEKQFVETTGNLENTPDSENTSDSIYSAHVAQLHPEGGMHSLWVRNNEKQNSHWARYTNRGDFETSFGGYYPEGIWNEMANETDRAEADALTFPVMTMEEARQIADRFLEQIGVDYLVLERNEKVIGKSNVQNDDGTRSGNLIKAYRFQYVRKISGVPITYTNVESSVEGEGESIVWSWDYETMMLIVDDRGIAGMNWQAPYKLMETITDSTAMLSFFKIQEIFEKMILIDHAAYADEGGADINITEVRLGLARIREQNNLAIGLLVPVWDFFGTRTVYYEGDDGQLKSHTQREPGKTLLTINAIDGAIIDRSRGY